MELCVSDPLLADLLEVLVTRLEFLSVLLFRNLGDRLRIGFRRFAYLLTREIELVTPDSPSLESGRTSLLLSLGAPVHWPRVKIEARGIFDQIRRGGDQPERRGVGQIEDRVRWRENHNRAGLLWVQHHF